MASHAISDIDFGAQICRILKLDPSKTRDITIFVKSESAVMVQVDQYLQEQEAGKIIKALKDFVSDDDEKVESTGEKLIHFTREEKPTRPEFPPDRIG